MFVRYVASEACSPLDLALIAIDQLMEEFSNSPCGVAINSTGKSNNIIGNVNVINGRLQKLREIHMSCQNARTSLHQLLAVQTFDAAVVLGEREDVLAWKFVRCQIDYFTTQASVL